jgi:hypothetical protein
MRWVVGLLLVILVGPACGRSSFRDGRGAEVEDAGGDPADAADQGPRELGPDRPDLRDADSGPDRPDPRDADGGPDRPDRPDPRDVDSGSDRPDLPRGDADVGPDRPDLGPDTGVCAEDCSRLDTACTRGVCDRASGQCVVRNAPVGFRCDDGNACTLDDVCTNGACVGRPLDCSGLDTACTVGSCDPRRPGQCLSTPLPEGSPCEDGFLCSQGDFCSAGQCIPGGTAGGCAAPNTIPLVVGTQQLSAPATCVVDEVRGSCAAASGPDAVWVVFNDGPRILLASAPAPSRLSSLVLAPICGPGAPQQSCGTLGAGARVRATALIEAGPNFVSVDSANALFPNGTSELEVTIDPHDRCAGAIPLTLPSVGTVEARGITVGANDDLSTPMCAGGSGGADHVYQLTVSQPSLVEMTLDPMFASPGYDSSLYVFAGPCGAGPVMPIACDDDSAGNFQPRFEATLQPGTYFVVVDGFGAPGANAGQYLLRITSQAFTPTLVFPDQGDARLQQRPGTYSQDGDFVEGARRPPLPSVRAADVSLAIDNRLTCDVLELAVIINGVVVGSAVIPPGLPSLSQTFSFPPIVGPNYSLRYEVVRDVAPMCGGVELPLGVSTITLRP